jgi:hypothetical protein
MSDKLTLKSNKCFFVGFLRKTKGYYFYNKAEGKVFVTRNGVFMEKEFLSKGVSGSKVQLEEIHETPKNISAPTDPKNGLEPWNPQYNSCMTIKFGTWLIQSMV